ncbi:MAG: TIGR00730 family Rossman fold protein [Coriobacteriia bacterium]|nr:TIGR00730 family Rossman fold protein [Coriobacteriia bacterium]
MIFCVFGGSNPGTNPNFVSESARFVKAIAEAGHSFTYGGGSTGIMGIAAQTALEANAHVTGIIPQFLMSIENVQEGLSELIITDDLPERQDLMMKAADVILTLPGGTGTMEEFFVALSQAQLGRRMKPLVVVNVDGFYDPLKALIDNLIDADFAPKEDETLVRFVSEPEEMFEFLENYSPLLGEKFRNDEIFS